MAQVFYQKISKFKARYKIHLIDAHQNGCDECGEKISSKWHLKKHKEKVHGLIPENVHRCKLCPKFFKQEGHLLNHYTKENGK